jgi:hypothetical protein
MEVVARTWEAQNEEQLQRSDEVSLTRRIHVGDEERNTGANIVKSTLIKLALTVGTLASALLAGAAHFRVG